MRLDRALVHRGLVESRTKAGRRIGAGDVLLNGAVEVKPATQVADQDRLDVRGGADFVGRGALKLQAALDHWGINPAGRRCLDLGASTGGFSEVLLMRGASHVVALDVGHGQLHPRLVADDRVLVVEGVNARDATKKVWSEIGINGVSLVVADLSFISLTHIIPPVVDALGPVEWVALLKPQFEVGRERLSQGIAKEADTHQSAIEAVVDVAKDAGLYLWGLMHSPITGEAGNREYLCWFGPTRRANQTQWNLDIHTLTHS